MSFRTHLEQVLNQVEGSVVCSVMGFDGMAIDTQQVQELDGLDLPAMLIEYGSILSKLKDAAASLQAGDISEISINTERLITIARMLTPEYYLVLAITPEGNYGKGRYVLRITAPKVKAELE